MIFGRIAKITTKEINGPSAELVSVDRHRSALRQANHASKMLANSLCGIRPYEIISFPIQACFL